MFENIFDVRIIAGKGRTINNNNFCVAKQMLGKWKINTEQKWSIFCIGNNQVLFKLLYNNNDSRMNDIILDNIRCNCLLCARRLTPYQSIIDIIIYVTYWQIFINDTYGLVSQSPTKKISPLLHIHGWILFGFHTLFTWEMWTTNSIFK